MHGLETQVKSSRIKMAGWFDYGVTIMVEKSKQI